MAKNRAKNVDENRPVGALSRQEAEKLAQVKGSVIYKVYGVWRKPAKPYLSKLTVCGYSPREGIIKSSTMNAQGYPTSTVLAHWFGDGERYGYLFSNYFHALAYSLHLKRGIKDANTAKADDVANPQPPQVV